MADNCCLPGSREEICERDNLIGDCTVRTQPFTLQAGTYTKGDVLFLTGVDDQLVNFATDPGGSTDENAMAIMPFDVVLADVDSMAVYVGGEFNQDKIIGFTDIAAVKIALSSRNIRIRKFY
jgi:hypothetical protein